jgi:hypothetical protein
MCEAPPKSGARLSPTSWRKTCQTGACARATSQEVEILARLNLDESTHQSE